MKIEHDGRLLPVQSGEKTILPNNETMYYNGFGHDYLGKDFEFTGRIKYVSNEGWTEGVHCEFEIVSVYEVQRGIFPFRHTKLNVVTKWLGENSFIFDKQFPTIEVIVDTANES